MADTRGKESGRWVRKTELYMIGSAYLSMMETNVMLAGKGELNRKVGIQEAVNVIPGSFCAIM